MKKQPIEEYIKCTNEFESILVEWFNIRNKCTATMDINVLNHLKSIEIKLDGCAQIIDDLRQKDYPAHDSMAAKPLFFEHIRQTPKNGIYKQMDLDDYKEIATELNKFCKRFSIFAIDTQKFHGKTKVRKILDTSDYINRFYYVLETCMYNDYKNESRGGKLLNIF